MAGFTSSMRENARELRIRGTVDTPAGSKLELEPEDVVSLRISEGVDSGVMPGAVISAECVLMLNAYSRRWSGDALKGAKLSLEIGVLADAGWLYAPMGVYYCEEVTEQVNSPVVELRCHDSIWFVTAEEFSDGLVYPCRLGDVLMAAMNQAGYRYTGIMPDDALVIDSAPDWNGASVRSVMGHAAAIMGCCVLIDRWGCPNLFRLAGDRTPVKIQPGQYMARSVNTARFGPVNRLEITTVNALGDKESQTETLTPSAAGGAECTIEVGGNPLFITGAQHLSALAEAMLEAVNGLEYTGCSFTWRGDPEIAPGRTVMLAGKDGDDIVCNVSRQTMTFENGFISECSCGVPAADAAAAVGWGGVVRAGSIVGVLSPGSIGAESITTSKLAAGAVTADKITAGAITANKITAGAVTADKLAAGSVTADKLDADSVTADKLTAGSVTADKLAADSVTASKIRAGAVETRTLAAASVTADKIAAGSITADRLKAGTITAESGVLGVAVIGTEQIADSSITAAKIVSLNADVINAGTLSVERLLIVGEDGVIHRINASSAGLTAEELTQDQYKNYINGTVIVAKSITAAQIAAKTITANEITAGAITSAEINTSELFASQAFVDALITTDIRSNSFLRLMIGDIHIGGTQLLLDTKHIDTGTGADKWRLSGDGATTRSQQGTDFKRIKLASTGAAANLWTGAASPVFRLPDGWQGKQVTLSAWMYSPNWAAVDTGITWTLALNNDGSTTRMRYRSKYSITKAGAAELGADADSDTALRNSRWTRVHSTFDLTPEYVNSGDQEDNDFNGNTHAYVQFFLPKNGEVQFYSPKLELGNKATDWTPAPEDPVEKLATSYIDIADDHVEIRSGGRFDVTADRYRFSLTEGDDDGIVMDIGEDGYTNFKGVKAGNLREAEYGEKAYPAEGGLAGLAIDLPRTDARRATYTAAADENGSVTLNGFNGYLYINGGGHRIPRITLGRGFTGTLMITNALMSQDGTDYALTVSNGMCVVHNAWFAPGTTYGILTEYGGTVRWFCNTAAANLTAMTMTRLFYARNSGAIFYTGKIPGGEILGTSGFITESSGTTTTVVGGTSTRPPETTKTVSLTAALGTYGSASGWQTTGCYQGYTNGKGRIFGCLKFDVSGVTGTVKSAKLTLHRKSGVGLARAVDVTVYTSAAAWGSAPGTLTKCGESAGLIAWGESGTLEIDATGAAGLVNGSAKQLVLYTGETAPESGKVYSQHYAQFDSAVLELTTTV